MNTTTNDLKTYVIRVGHWKVNLRAHDADEAITFARRQMAHELPRLYDIIKNLTTTHFQVEPAA